MKGLKKKTIEKLKDIINKILSCLILFLVILMFSWLIDYVLNYYHEAVHETICLEGGGEIVEKHVSSYDGHVICSISSDNIIEGFMLTEIVGYHLMGFVKVIEILIFVILSFVIIKE